MDEEQEREPESPAPAEEPRPLVVGLGASAGGLEALEEFFQHVPENTGVVYVVVTHLAPGRVSLLPDLLARHARMPVAQVNGPTKIEPDHVYLAPPGVNLGILNGVLHPMEIVDGAPKSLPIDYFFRSLAQDQRERAVGVVLSGTGTDGTIGLKEIKAASGLVVAQEEGSARYSGMPHSAIEGLRLDFVLPPAQIPERIQAYARRVLSRGPGTLGGGENEAPEILHRIFLLLRSRTGHDFSSYKSSTIRRRIERRMNVHQIETPREYLRFLQTEPNELDQLFKELLINVTSFFRDAEAWDVLAQAVIPSLIADKPDDYVLRVWVPGCSSGEEAYSLAMLFRERMEQLGRHNVVQIFATDLDAETIEHARAGLYPDSIAADLTPRRLERFFVREVGTCKIRKEVREMLAFAQQNLIADPPFTKLDLLSCRNLLIYLDGRIQQRIIPMFHYALRPGGVLFLGSSETVGGAQHLFEPVDKKWKIFRRKEVASSGYVVDLPPTALPADPGTRELAGPPANRKATEVGLGQLAERTLLQHLVPPAVLIHERGEIVHIHGRTGMFLEPAPGPQAQANIYNMAREGLQLELAVAIRNAAATDGEVLHRGARVRTNGHSVVVNLRARRLAQPESLRGLFLVAFEKAEAVEAEGATTLATPELNDRVAELERELQHGKEIHQSTIEELETANEELKSTNEEMQSTNEELQSANEELETSKEEMQSLNEELQTVNSELQGKVEELSRANDDMKNLLNATDIATIFLDNDLNITRYTERAKRVIRLIPGDVGRPIGDLVSRLRYTGLVEDAREVLATLVFKEAEVQSEDGGWYLMRVLPYRTMENVIDGLVVTFVDVSKVKALQEQTRRMLDALRGSATTVFGHDKDLRYTWTAGPVFGRAPDDVLQKTDWDILPAEDARAVSELKRRVLDQGSARRERLTLSVGSERKTFDFFVEPARQAQDIAGVTGVMTELLDSKGG